jgi:hypothetical protein
MKSVLFGKLLLERQDLFRAFMEYASLKDKVYLRSKAQQLAGGQKNSIGREGNYLWAARWIKENDKEIINRLEA